jgi:hypothetical protein
MVELQWFLEEFILCAGFMNELVVIRERLFFLGCQTPSREREHDGHNGK